MLTLYSVGLACVCVCVLFLYRRHLWLRMRAKKKKMLHTNSPVFISAAVWRYIIIYSMTQHVNSMSIEHATISALYARFAFYLMEILVKVFPSLNSFHSAEKFPSHLVFLSLSVNFDRSCTHTSQCRFIQKSSMTFFLSLSKYIEK